MTLKDKNLKVTIFTGDWCPMCREALPDILNFLRDKKADEDDMELTHVNTFKTQPAELIDKYKIKRVPTVIFEQNETEVGRITEFAPMGWLQEMERIFNNSQ